MSLCPTCAAPLEGETQEDRGIHAYHDIVEAGWAAGNRRLCDFFHRGKPLPRPEPEKALDVCPIDWA